jgi:hypothetical protein
MVTPVKCVEYWWRSQFTNRLLAWRLAPSGWLWHCYSCNSWSYCQPGDWHRAGDCGAVTAVTVGDCGAVTPVTVGLSALHRHKSRISCWNSSRKSSSWSCCKLTWFKKNYTVDISSLNNQSSNHRQSSWAVSVSSVAQKTCFNLILNFVIARPNSSQLIPIHMSTLDLPNTC